MDSKISQIVRHPFIFLALIALLFTGCKTNDWADWKVRNEVWLRNNAKQDGVQTTSSGLQYKIIADPTPLEAKPNQTSTIICDYKLELINGYVVEEQNNVQLSLAYVVPGFSEGCHHIHNHGDIQLFIPAYLGYDYEKYSSKNYNKAEGFGTEGTQGYIPPYSTLIYTVHLCSISE